MVQIARTSFRKATRRQAAGAPPTLLAQVRGFFARQLWRIFGLALLGLSGAAVLALMSYTPADASFNSLTNANQPIANWLGQPGAKLADVLMQPFGYAAWLLPLIWATWGWRYYVVRPLHHVVGRLLMAALAVLASGVALSLLFPMPQPQLTPPLGGAFGWLLASQLQAFWPGTLAVLVLAGVSLVLAALCCYMACALSREEWSQLLQWGQALLAEVQLALHELSQAVARWWQHGGWRRGQWLTAEQDILEAEVADSQVANPVAAPAGSVALPSAAESKPRAIPVKRPAASARQAKLSLDLPDDTSLPPLDLLQLPDPSKLPPQQTDEILEQNAKALEAVLADFGIEGSITKVSPGPVVTLYELEPAPGIRASRVIALADDIARSMSAASVRVAVVPGRNVIGIELPNQHRETVLMREMLVSAAYQENSAALPLILGKDIAGAPVIADLAKMPHLLVAGTTGSGKSVSINTMILSLVYRLPPAKCRFIMVDPKMLELSVYDHIPHLLAPVVTEPKKAIVALKWTVREMEERYRAMSKLQVRNIEGYNARLRVARENGESLTRQVQTGFDQETGRPIYEEQPLDLTELPYIVVIVDEMADLMLVAGKEIEIAVQRLAQMARAAGIHMIMATQRPSVDVITGTIKANFPTRISFQVTSKIDSRTILGEQGAEQLLGQGDMLYMAGGGRVTRVHGPFVRDSEVEAVVKFLRSQGEPDYLDDVTSEDESLGELGEMGGMGGGNTGAGDGLYDKAVDIVQREGKASTSFLQRHLAIGYNKAASLIERMEKEGVVSAANHVGKREVFGGRR